MKETYFQDIVSGDIFYDELTEEFFIRPSIIIKIFNACSFYDGSLNKFNDNRVFEVLITKECM